MLAHASSAKLINLLHKPIKELAVVAHHYHSAVEVAYGIFQHVFGAHIKVVGRLIENQQIHRLK